MRRQFLHREVMDLIWMARLTCFDRRWYHLAVARKQRGGTKFTGAFGQRTGDSDLLFIEGQLPDQNGAVSNDASASKQLELCLENLESVLAQRGHTVDDVLQITLYLADMDTVSR